MPIDFANFDQRHYPVVSTRDGYGEWADSYEATVPDEMDIRLLARLTPENWKNITAAADLGCGTGRIGGWLKSNGVTTIDGIDLTPEMLKLARVKNVYRTLREGDVSRTAFADASYDLAIASLMDEHIRDLATLYR
ncbi:MAG: class I SAM-dependent methyltransferase [Phycisphaerae bacterium]